MPFSVSENALKGLICIHKYRFLTIEQYATVTGLSRNSSSRNLRDMELMGWLGHIGNMPIRGQGKTPKTYYLKERGYEGLLEHTGASEERLGSFVKAHTGISWSPVMYHRLDIVTVLLNMHIEAAQTAHLQLLGTRLEYARDRVGGKLQSETTDRFQGHRGELVRIVPDAAFALKNVETGSRALYFLELDRDTEPINSSGRRNSIMGKFEKYDAYLQSRAFRETYAHWGEFRNFTCLFVTPGLKDGRHKRLDNIREASRALNERFHPFYRLSSFELTRERFFHDKWSSRDIEDDKRYRLIREG